MAQRFNLPDIGSGLQEAEIISWLVEVGDQVTTDQMLCEVETEKSVVEIPVPFSGVVLEVAGPAGTSVMVGEMLVVIDESEDAAAMPPGAPAPVPPAVGVVAPEAAPVPATPSDARRPQAMPLVRKVARDRGIDLATVVGTGAGGRVTRADVENAAAGPMPDAPVVASQPVARSTQRVKLSKLRRTIGAHMTAQWRSVPHITAHVEADASRLMTARARLSERLGRKIPIDALLVAAVVPALQQFPVANAAVDGDDLLTRDFFDIGVAVGSPDGLLVPIVRDAQSLDLGTLVDVVADLTSRAKDRKILQDEMGDQTFTISNLGGLRGWHATQVIPAGTTGIVSFGRAIDRPIVRDGSIVSAPVMAISGTFDHRAMDGVEAMGVVNAIVDVIEEPALLLL
jgi:pyruvate/2-oxoglutarate dehydrogenase complex dihydrolipoamide acyltransferase (E2) component